MRTAGRFLASSFVVMFAAGPAQIALAAVAIMLRAGEAKDPTPQGNRTWNSSAALG
jgi:hypothetical protein